MSIIATDEERAFRVRFRLPRPIARSFESVGYSTGSDERDARIAWCAGTAVKRP